MMRKEWMLLAVVLFTTACGDCGDTTDGWRVEETVDTDGEIDDTGSALTDMGTDVSVADVSTEDVEVTPDLPAVDQGREDAGDDAGADLGDTDTWTGWYSSAFEHSGFVPHVNGESAAVFPNTCNAYIQPKEDAEIWWVLWNTPEMGLPLLPYGTQRIGLLDARGSITEKGQYGHLGGYDREFSVDDATLRVCETFEEFRHCVVPRAGDECVTPDFHLAMPANQTTSSELVEILPGPASTRRFFELHVLFDENVPDGSTEVIAKFDFVPVDSDGGPDKYDVDEMDGASLKVIRYGVFVQETTYNNALDGWVIHDVDAGTFKVSMSGESDDGEQVHTWGHYTVDRVIGLP